MYLAETTCQILPDTIPNRIHFELSGRCDWEAMKIKENYRSGVLSEGTFELRDAAWKDPFKFNQVKSFLLM